MQELKITRSWPITTKNTLNIAAFSDNYQESTSNESLDVLSGDGFGNKWD